MIDRAKLKSRGYLALAALMAVGMLYRLTYEFNRLLFSKAENAAIDLWQRHDEVRAWFAGQPVYQQFMSAVYPPASYLMLWPFMAFRSLQTVKWVWAVSSVVLLAYIIRALLQRDLFKTTREKVFWAVFILAHYATGITIGNGQLTIYIMATVLALNAFIKRDESNWISNCLIGFFAALSLLKPTTGVPFILLVMFVPRNIYPLLATVAIYALLALAAASFQSDNIIQLHRDWFSLGSQGAVWSSDAGNVASEGGSDAPILAFLRPGEDIGYGNVHTLLGALNLSKWASIISLALLAPLGVWIYLYRSCNQWVLLGVAAIFSRVWAYHRVYDDMFILLPIFAVITVLKLEMNPRLQWAGRALLVLLFISSLLPASLRLLPAPLGSAYTIGQPVLWLLTLAYLIHSAHVQKQRDKADSPLSAVPKAA